MIKEGILGCQEGRTKERAKLWSIQQDFFSS
jgi:hypothetical protein